MGSNISSNDNSESDTDIDDDYMVDEHLQGFPLLQISIPFYTIICTIDSFISYQYHVHAIIFIHFMVTQNSLILEILFGNTNFV